jgi:hypothetical protein
MPKQGQHKHDKSEVDYDLRNRLIGVREPARTPGR